MRIAHEWAEDDVEALVKEEFPEDISLEYKAAAALAKEKKAEISKEVSAVANSAGGLIIYGINEQKKSHGPIVPDAVDETQFTLEWLEQVIDGGI